MSDVREIAAGSDHVLALKNDGTVWAWGSNKYGQLGDGTTNPHCQPVQLQKHGKTYECPTGYKPVQVIIPPLDKADTTRLVR